MNNVVDQLHQQRSTDITPKNANDFVFTYEESIKGLQFYFSYSVNANVYILMLIEDPENIWCALPEVYVRIRTPEGYVTFIDLDNYPFPAEALCPLRLNFLPLDSYVLITYPKILNNGNLENRGFIMDYSGNIIK